ncbi:MAG: hypothetical protein KDD62_10560, partial [Bdellovibrionales bacterium]|nr:hypothetical protein [Bdellovibrionales bacterium]
QSEALVGMGVERNVCGSYLALQNAIKEACTELERYFHDLDFNVEQASLTDMRSKLDELPSSSEMQFNVDFLCVAIDMLRIKLVDVSPSDIIMDLKLNDSHIDQVVELYNAFCLHPFDGRVRDSGLLIRQESPESFRQAIQDGARFNCILNTAGQIAGLIMYYNPEDVQQGGSFTNLVKSFYPEREDVGAVQILLVDPLCEDFSLYRSLVFSARLALQQAGASQAASFVHENNINAALVHVNRGGATLHCDQKIPVVSSIRSLDQEAGEAPQTYFYLLSFDCFGDAVSRKRAEHTSGMAEFLSLLNEDAAKVELRNSKRLGVLAAKQELLKKLEALENQSENCDLEEIATLVSKVAIPRSQLNLYWQAYQSLSHPAFKNLAIETMRTALGSSAAIEREIANLEKA